jgi:hypothetical protein
MAKQVLTNPQIIVNGVDLSDHIDSVTLDESYADVDTTAFGSGSKTRVAGLGDHKITLEFQQDFAASSVDATINPLIGGTATISVKPLSAATSTTNPGYSVTALITDWKPVDGKVGELLKSSVTWPVSGAVNRGIT